MNKLENADGVGKFVTNKEYKRELKEMVIRMRKAESFAKKIPIFSSKILEDKISADFQWIRFGKCYKGMDFAWGINRGHFFSGGNRIITNYKKDNYDEYLFAIYINTLTIYDSHKKYGLNDIVKKVDVFFYDRTNTTFYVADENIEKFLDALCEWKEKAKEKAFNDSKKSKIDVLQKQIDKLREGAQKQINKLRMEAQR